MRKNLGNFMIIFLLLFNLNLFASSYEWSASVDKKTAFVNEAILLTYVCKFSDRSELYSIDFNPVVNNENYTIKLLSEKEQIIDGKRVNSFEYIAYVKRAGKMVFDFDMVMKKTNKESIENTVLGRDNEQYEEFTSIYLKQKSLYVDIKPTDANLVGNFELEVIEGKESVKAYEPYSLEFIIKGTGNFQKLKPIMFEIDGVKVFSQKVILKSSLKEDGEHGVWSQKFAFVSDKSFVIPKVEFEYFNIDNASTMVLRFNEVHVEVTPAYKKTELLDEGLKGFEFKFEYLYYLLTFILGFIIAKISFKKEKKLQTKKELFCQRVKSSKTMKELSLLLAIDGSIEYRQILLDIENDELSSLGTAKKLICD